MGGGEKERSNQCRGGFVRKGSRGTESEKEKEREGGREEGKEGKRKGRRKGEREEESEEVKERETNLPTLGPR